MQQDVRRGCVEVLINRVAGAEDMPLPVYATAGSAGADLHAAVTEPVVVRMGEVKMIPTGLMIAIPAHYEGQVRPRSGLALRAGLTLVNAPGTIDSDYRGELNVLVTCVTMKPYTIRRGDRIAQLVFCPVARANFEEVESLPPTARGAQGFGHTGVRMEAAGS
ncbi:MAG: dUTP diphosphatase [Planctomycetes bacterium]|nr:dUTP diphosphatase [Planctomycetota bacterium]